MPDTIDIIDYSISRLDIEANEKHAPRRDSPARGALAVQWDVVATGDARTFQINARITVNKDTRSFQSAKYRIVLHIKTLYAHEADALNDRLIRIAVSTTYSLARGVIGQATASAPFGTYLLPIVSINDIMQHATNAPQAQGGRITE